MKKLSIQSILLLPLMICSSLVFGQQQDLKEVSIKARKSAIKQEADRVSYDMQADPESKTSNLLEMLRKVPYVTVDANENIMLKGNSSYKILINGKPSSLMERDPKTILKSIPASTILRIEVYTTPPAKYDAEGLGGVINIITNKKLVDGYNGTVNLNTRFPGGPGVGASFSAKVGKFGISAFGGGNLNDNPQTTSGMQRTTTGASPSFLDQEGVNKSHGKNGYAGTELSYEIDSLNLISGNFNISGSNASGLSNQTTLLTGPGGVINGYHLQNNNSSGGNGFDAAVNYQLGFKNNKNKLLTFSYRYFKYNNNSAANITTANRVSYTFPDYNQENVTSASEQTVQLDFVEGFKRWTVEAGIKGIFRDNTSDFNYSAFVDSLNRFENDPVLSNQYNSKQNILAAYNTWGYNTDAFSVKAGLRIERTFTDADFVSTATVAHQRYLDILPSVAFNFPINKLSSINAGFSQRLKRPGLYKLNPFVDRSNPNFQSYGNPDLKQVEISDTRIGYSLSGKGNLNLGVFYDFGSGLDLPLSHYDPTTKITYTTYENNGDFKGFGNFININYPLTKQLSIGINSNIMIFSVTGQVDGTIKTVHLHTIGIYNTLGYTFDDSWRANVNVDINGKNPTGLQGFSSGVVNTGLSVNKQIIKNQLVFSAAVRNPFTKYRYAQTQTTSAGFTQTQTDQSYFRNFTFSLNYTFGKLKNAVQKTKRGINNDDGAR
ncbi:outer membrane beta-barrel protein [Mucilaginibacter ximonensis]|uniref:Outer membrane beta-barrel protein n=1 Tax=Mucilaginibacter ximonensis TaxID=538021 RepID=A0ABW5YD13_9SPHI